MTYRDDYVPILPPKNTYNLFKNFYQPCINVHYIMDEVTRPEYYSSDDLVNNGMIDTIQAMYCAKCVIDHCNMFGQEINDHLFFFKGKK